METIHKFFEKFIFLKERKIQTKFYKNLIMHTDLLSRIDRLEKENKEMREEIRFLKACLNPSPYLQVNFLIPVGQNWTVETPTKCTLSYSDKSFAVIASDVANVDQKNHTPNFLFDGKKENEGGSKWATSSGQTSSFIQVDFGHQIVANVLTITARDTQNMEQAPGSFEIFGIDSSGNIQSFKKFYNVEWTANEKKLFSFCNTKPYVSYKIMFYSTKRDDKCYGIAELNLGAFTI